MSLVVWSQGDNEQAGSLAEAGLAAARAVGDEDLTALAIHLLGIVELVRGRLDRARRLMEETLGLQRALGLASDGAMPLMILSQIAYGAGDADLATARAEEALAISRRLGHPAGALGVLARVARDRGDERRAVTEYREMLALWSAVDARYASGGTPIGTTRTTAFPRWASVDDRRSVVLALTGLAAIAAAHGEAEQAATLVGAVDRWRDEVGTPVGTDDHATQDRVAAAVCAALGEERFAALRAAGRDLPLRAAIAVALRIEPTVLPTGASRRRPSTPGADPLTPRERDVLRLLVKGRSNAEIADALFVGTRTARMHVANILAKLGVATRTAAAAHAIRHELV